MAHELVTDSAGNTSMVYFGSVPWHGLGHALTKDERWDLAAAQKKGNMDFECELVGLQTADKKQSVKAKAIRRKDNGQVLCDHVGMIYHLVQPATCFDFFKPFVDTKAASLHTAGLLHEGKKIWVLCKIERDPIELGKDDVVEKFILLANSYDGTTSVYVGFTPVRVVCANTLALAVDDKASRLLRVRHTKSVKQSLEDIRDVIDMADAQFVATAEQYKRLVRKNINQADVEKYVKQVFNINGDKLNGQQQTILETVVGLTNTGKGQQLKTSEGTLWGAYNAVTEFLAYNRGVNADTRLTSLWWGASAKTNHRALEVALALAA